MLDKTTQIHAPNARAQRPRFMVIADDIRARIAGGSLGPHDIIPSERTLSDQFDVSRMTARRALESLEGEGLVYSADRRGRFVSPQRLQYDVSNMVSFVSDAQSRGGALEIELVQSHVLPADVRLAQALDIPESAPLYAYTRIFRTDGHAIFVETEYVSADRFPDFLDHDLAQSTTQILDRVYGSSARTGDIVIRMRGANPDEARWLGVADNHAAIELEQIIRDDHDQPFCFGRQVWRGELAEFSAHAIVSRSPA